MGQTGIIVLEGADAAGKTTLARHLVDRYGARYIHNGIYRDVWRSHTAALRLAVRWSADRLVVVDRHWLSELIYGRAFRGGPAYDVGARCFDRVLRRYGALTVLCAPVDQRRQAQRWADGRAAGKHEHFDRVKEVIQLYADLRHGNVAHPGDGYLDQLIRFQDFTERDDVIVYDLDQHRGPRGIAAFGRLAARQLRELSDRIVPRNGANLSGRDDATRPGVLFVGEAVSPRTATYAAPPWPWCDRDDRITAGSWFNRALHALHAREDRLVFTNAIPPPGHHDHLPELLSIADGSPSNRVIALGLTAHQRVRELGGRCSLVAHPQWHRRFRYHEGPEGYGKLLSEAMR